MREKVDRNASTDFEICGRRDSNTTIEGDNLGRCRLGQGLPQRLYVAGEMAERSKAHAWKACVGETLPRVRIPLSPPFIFCQLLIVRWLQYLLFCRSCFGSVPVASLETLSNPSRQRAVGRTFADTGDRRLSCEAQKVSNSCRSPKLRSCLPRPQRWLGRTRCSVLTEFGEVELGLMLFVTLPDQDEVPLAQS